MVNTKLEPYRQLWPRVGKTGERISFQMSHVFCLSIPKRQEGRNSWHGGFLHVSAGKEITSEEAANPSVEESHPPSRGGGGGARRISWDKSLTPPSPSTFPRTSDKQSVGGNSLYEVPPEGGRGGGGRGGGGSRAGDQPRQSATALGWSSGFSSSPEVQMQVLVEVGNLVRAAARKRGASQRKQRRKLSLFTRSQIKIGTEY